MEIARIVLTIFEMIVQKYYLVHVKKKRKMHLLLSLSCNFGYSLLSIIYEFINILLYIYITIHNFVLYYSKMYMQTQMFSFSPRSVCIEHQTTVCTLK